MPEDRVPQVKDERLYRALRARGDSESKAARIANAHANGSLRHRSTPLDGRSKADLMAEARRIGIQGRSAMNKAELEQAIRDS